jgi:hypothetical protein
MPNAYILNQIPTAYSTPSWLLTQMLLAAGWTYKSGGDGLAVLSATPFSNGNVSGVNGWANTKAWARMSDPANVREIIIQHDNSGGLRLKYSPLAKFVSGSASATVTPSATDERYIRGASSDAVPSYGSGWVDGGVPSGLTKFQGMASGSAPYGFWICGATTPAGAIKTGLMLDPVDGAAEDTDLAVWHVGTTTAFSPTGLGNISNNNASGASNAGNWGFMDVAKTVFPQLQAACLCLSESNSNQLITGYSVAAAGLANNPFNSKGEAFAVPYMRLGSLSNGGNKGMSKYLRWTGVARTNFIDTLDTKAWIAVGSVWLPWDGTTTPTN